MGWLNELSPTYVTPYLSRVKRFFETEMKVSHPYCTLCIQGRSEFLKQQVSVRYKVYECDNYSTWYAAA
jgi:hypothetical protein